MPTAQVPGFRPGHAPRKLIEHRFRKDVAEQVKSELLMDSMAQINEERSSRRSASRTWIWRRSRLPDEGPLTFEFDLEVRPEFDLPQWKGLTIEKPVREFSDADVDRALQRHPGQPRPAGALRRAGRAGRLHHHQSDLQARRPGAFQRQGRSDPHPAGAQLPRRQDRGLRQADGGRPGGRDPRRARPSSATTPRTRRCAGRRSRRSSRCWRSRSWNCPS